MGGGRGDTAFVVVHAATQTERVLVVRCNDGGGSGAGAPEPGRRWRWRGAVVVVHASSEAEGVLGVIVSLMVLVVQRFVP